MVPKEPNKMRVWLHSVYKVLPLEYRDHSEQLGDIYG